MYYVAKMYKYSNPSIVESFDNLALAQSYANVMNAAGKGQYTVLISLPKEN